MNSSDYFAQITNIGGNVIRLPLVLQSDGEGNGYEYARGVAEAYVTADLESTFDTLEEAKECGYAKKDLKRVLIIYP